MRVKKLVDDLQMRDKQIDLLKKMITKAKNMTSANGDASENVTKSEIQDMKTAPEDTSGDASSDAIALTKDIDLAAINNTLESQRDEIRNLRSDLKYETMLLVQYTNFSYDSILSHL